MRPKLKAVILTIIILAVTYGMYVLLFTGQARQTSAAVQGVLDLTGFSIAEGMTVPLNGQWAFYPGRLLAPDDFHFGPAEAGDAGAGWIRVPGSWTTSGETANLATYRLQIRIAEADAGRVYGLKTSSIQIANRLYINGEEAGSSGSPGEKPDYWAANRPYVSYFTLRPGDNELIVQVANYEFPASSGINEPLFFGAYADISRLRDKALAYDWMIFVAFMIMALYFIGLYTQRREDYSLLAFGLFCFFIAAFSSTRGERIVYDLLGSIPYGLFLRIQMLSVLGASMGLLFYVYRTFQVFCSRSFVRWMFLSGAGLTLAILGWATVIMTEGFRTVITIYGNVLLLYAMYVFVLAALHKVEGSLLLAVAAVGINLHTFVQNLNIYGSIPLYTAAPYPSFLFLLMLALLMSLRFSNAFKKIEELSVQLLKGDKLKDEFLARTSHEFKTPLHGVRNVAQSMLDDCREPLTEAQREKVTLIAGIADRLSKLVYDILDLSMLKQGQLSVRPVPVDVRSAVEMQMRLYAYLTDGTQVSLLNQVPEHLPPVLADESRFSQIVGNLLDNAVKHTRSGRIEVTAALQGDKVDISVADTGDGIDSAELESIFEPFRTMDSAEHQSFGLGLPIVKQLVELHNGTITVTSSPGSGSTFVISLPASTAGKLHRTVQQELAPVPPAADYTFPTPYYSEHQGMHTVLVVDDQFSNLKILIDLLQGMDCSVIAVSSGHEAIGQIQAPRKIDLVVLDLMMPGMNGYEVCQTIRKTHTMLEMPVIIVTAGLQPQDKLAAFEAGANDILLKPFDTGELKARIGSLLVMKRSLEKTVELEVAFLQSQIKPHFLYNVLNTIVATSYTDADQSRKLTTDLADYLRGSFRFSNVDKRISFGEELQLIRSYIEIERARFRERLQVHYEIAEEMHQVSLPPLLIQPLVENAVRHGIGGRIGGGTVSITAGMEGGACRIIIEDNGVGIEDGRLRQLLGPDPGVRQGVGLLNINKRLKYEYGSELEIASEPGHGTKVTVRIPCRGSQPSFPLSMRF